MKVLDMKGVVLDGKYLCSESATLTVRNYFEEPELSLDQLQDKECVSFDTIRPCLPKGYKYDSCDFNDIKRSIDKKDPVLVSMVPDSNIRRWLFFGEDPRHSIVIHGYDDKNYYVISDGKKYKVDRSALDRTRKRVGFVCIIK